jgi:hypothetical protein
LKTGGFICFGGLRPQTEVQSGKDDENASDANALKLPCKILSWDRVVGHGRKAYICL